MPGETGGLVIDIVIVVLALLFAGHGYRQGFIISAATFVGFLGGAVLGVQLVPWIAGYYHDPSTKLLAALIVIFATALICQAVCTFLGHKLRRHLRWEKLRKLDHIGGPIVSLSAVFLATWLIAAPLAMGNGPFSSLHSAACRIDCRRTHSVRRPS